ncbi:MAG: hypothetical protein FWG70_04305 [Oscillospiraceae bacterium]|nr:hypothetical protein [Oscillospiraceae bacterium]
MNKKLFSIIIAMIMLFSLTMSVMAEDDSVEHSDIVYCDEHGMFHEIQYFNYDSVLIDGNILLSVEEQECSHSNSMAFYEYYSSVHLSHPIYNGSGQVINTCSITRILYILGEKCTNCGHIKSSSLVTHSESHTICI